VSTLQVAGRKSLVLLSGRAYPQLAEQIAAEMGVTLMPVTARDFANGETFIKPDESVRGTDAFVIQSFTTPINEWVMESLILVDALNRASAKRITVVMPFYPYARQDKKHRGREPISARLIADLYKTAGADRLMAIDLHNAQIQGFFDGPVDHLSRFRSSPLRQEQVRLGETSRSSRPTPAASAWPNSGPTSWVDARSPSCTRRATRTSPTRSSRTASSAISPGRRAC